MGPKQPICPEQSFLVKTIVITFIYLLALFIVQNLKKKLQRIQNYDDAPFLSPKWSICPLKKFFSKIITIIPIYLLAPFIALNFLQNSSTRCDNMQFMRPKLSISPSKNFFRKPANEPCFFYSCLSTYQKSKTDITLLVIY